MARSEGILKNPVTPPGIDPDTVRLVARRLNNYANPGPSEIRDIYMLLVCGYFETRTTYTDCTFLIFLEVIIVSAHC